MDNSNSNRFHQPVLVRQVLEGLKIHQGRQYIDTTIGDGGHALKIIEKGGWLLGIDRDADQIERAKRRIERSITTLSYQTSTKPPKPRFVTGNFAALKAICQREGFAHPFGILFDLGVSSFQLDSTKLGLSFTADVKLDMRLDSQAQYSAKELINNLTEEELYEIFTRNAQEELARPISQAIVNARSLKPIATTAQLAQIVANVKSKKIKSKLHPATKVFLALRIEVNNEIENLKLGLSQAVELLQAQGRLVVISFHETEDRIVKRFFNKEKRKGEILIINKKPITPETIEIHNNPRSRSAKLRIAQRI